MSELLSKVAELLNAPESLVQRSAEARAEASGRTVDEVLQSWAGGESVASVEKPAEEAPPAEEPEPPVEDKADVEEPKEEPAEIIKDEKESSPVVSSQTNIKKVIQKVSFANKTLDIKVNAETSLPRWLNFSFVLIPLFIVIGIVNTSSTQECGENGILDVDRKTQLTVNCDGSAFEGKGVGSAGWQAEIGPAYGAENKVSIGGMPGFAGKLTEDEIYAVVVFERVVFGLSLIHISEPTRR